MPDNAFGVICVTAKEGTLQGASFFSSALAAVKILEFHKCQLMVKSSKTKKIIRKSPCIFKDMPSSCALVNCSNGTGRNEVGYQVQFKQKKSLKESANISSYRNR